MTMKKERADAARFLESLEADGEYGRTPSGSAARRNIAPDHIMSLQIEITATDAALAEHPNA